MNRSDLSNNLSFIQSYTLIILSVFLWVAEPALAQTASGVLEKSAGLYRIDAKTPEGLRSLLNMGIDLIETDLPRELGQLLYGGQ